MTQWMRRDRTDGADRLLGAGAAKEVTGA